MSEPSHTPDELTAAESQLADHLSAQRPVPPGAFHGELGRHLAALDRGYGPRPQRLRAIVALYLTAGAMLIGLGALIATGAI